MEKLMKAIDEFKERHEDINFVGTFLVLHTVNGEENVKTADARTIAFGTRESLMEILEKTHIRVSEEKKDSFVNW